MISDKERRRIANELREAASAKGKRSGSMERMLSKLLGIAKQDRGVFGQPVESRQHGETFTGALPI